MQTPERATSKTRVAITLGDPGGIGPEVALKSAAAVDRDVAVVFVGSGDVLRAHAQRLNLDAKPLRSVTCLPETLPSGEQLVLDVAGEGAVTWNFGVPTPAGGRLSMQAVERAVDLCRAGRADAMVTAPISKAAIAQGGYAYPGHTEFIAERTEAGPHAMMMVAGALRVALVTGHLPIAEVSAALTSSAIQQKINILSESLRRDFNIEVPRVAVLGLNPHAGDGGVLGSEEQDVIAPALEAARSGSLHVDGPFPADGFFGLSKQNAYDALLAMYHDQGLIPFKALAFEEGVNYTAGLPIVRTSPDHGTAYDIAGEGAASPASMTSALNLAVRIAQRRADFG